MRRPHDATEAAALQEWLDGVDGELDELVAGLEAAAETSALGAQGIRGAWDWFANSGPGDLADGVGIEQAYWKLAASRLLRGEELADPDLRTFVGLTLRELARRGAGLPADAAAPRHRPRDLMVAVRRAALAELLIRLGEQPGDAAAVAAEALHCDRRTVERARHRWRDDIAVVLDARGGLAAVAPDARVARALELLDEVCPTSDRKSNTSRR